MKVDSIAVDLFKGRQDCCRFIWRYIDQIAADLFEFKFVNQQ